MSIKVALLKSGEQIIADIKEMVSGSEDNGDLKVLGYFFEFPYVIHLRNPELVIDKNSPLQLEISLFNWTPLSKDHIIPVSTDWVVTIFEPVKKVKDMYGSLMEKIKEGEKNGKQADKIDSVDEQSDFNLSD